MPFKLLKSSVIARIFIIHEIKTKSRNREHVYSNVKPVFFSCRVRTDLNLGQSFQSSFY